MILDKVNDILNTRNQNDSIYAIAGYIKSHIDEIPFLTIDAVAAGCFVSKGQISKTIRTLGYENYASFKDACRNYVDSLERKSFLFNKAYGFPENVALFNQKLSETFQYVTNHLDYATLEKLVNVIGRQKRVYLFAQGDIRSVCHTIQIELSRLSISTVICDADFDVDFPLNQDDFLLVLSVNGNTFRYSKRITRRIKSLQNTTWLITCNDQLEFPNKCVVPSNETTLNDFALKYVVDVLLAGIIMQNS